MLKIPPEIFRVYVHKSLQESKTASKEVRGINLGKKRKEKYQLLILLEKFKTQYDRSYNTFFWNKMRVFPFSVFTMVIHISFHSCFSVFMFLPWTPYLSSPFSWKLLFYLSLHHFPPGFLSLSPPQAKFPRLYLAPWPLLPLPGLYFPCLSFASQQPKQNNTGSGTGTLTKRRAVGKKTLLIKKEASILKISVGRCC